MKLYNLKNFIRSYIMNYTLNNLGSRNFEHLIQALSKKIIGEGLSVFGTGPDGQREATFNGKAPYPSSTEPWDGYWIIQAKFKEPNTKKPDYLWLKDCFESEMKAFKKKKDEGKKVPDNYLFFTNIVLTPVAEKGIKDKINSVSENYNNLIPHIHILGADDIVRFLEGHRDVATSYASYILSGDILSRLYENITQHEKERQNAFFRYLAQTFDDDYCSRMEQAGNLTEEKISIDKVYIDLNFKFEETENTGKFISHAINIGNHIYRYSILEHQKMNPNNTVNNINKYVLKGSAGQGKSTVCQFLAQIYRATFIKNFSEVFNHKTEKFINRICEDGISLPICHRVPIRIELRLYSSWMLNRQKENKSFDLVTYISSIIAEKSSQKFDNETLRLYFKKYSWAFFFDGLDEVPESSNRKELMIEINRFMEIELRQADTDSLFFATTRPEGYVGEFSKSNFTHIDLIPLDRTSCFEYLNKLMNAIEDDSTKRKDYLKILNEGLDNEQIAFMMKTPLQATIIAILVRAGGEPPRDKYSLFKEYFDIILKREKQKGMGSILNINQDLVEGVYYLLGYELQKRSSTIEVSDALISLGRMKELIREKLNQDGIDENAPNFNNLLDETYSIIVHRINFASEIKEGYIGFSIRSMQEFLAAVHIVKTFDDKNLRIVLKDLARSSYWKNTFIFLVECITKIKTYYLDHLIDTVLGELNGSDLNSEEMCGMKSIYLGSQVAFTLLSNNIFKNKPKYENKLCKHIEKYSHLEFWDNMSSVLTMSDNVKSELTDYLVTRDFLTNADFALASLLIQDQKNKLKLIDFAQTYAAEITTQYFKMFNISCPEQLHEVVSIAINKGTIIKLNLTQISDIILHVKNLTSDKAKETIFKITIKCLLSQDNLYQKEEKELNIINDYFQCDFSVLCNRHHFIKETDITEYLTLNYGIPEIDKSKIYKLIALTDKYALDGLSLILKTIASLNISEYIYFFNNIDKYKDEIYAFNGEILIRKNILMWRLWQQSFLSPHLDINKLIGNDIDLSKHYKSINNLTDLLNKSSAYFLLYSFSISGPFEHFFDFMSKVQESLPESKIKENPLVCSILCFIFILQYEDMYFKENSDSRTNSLNLLNRHIKQIIEYIQVVNDFTWWKKCLWCIFFLNLQRNDFISYANLSFVIPEHQKNKIKYFRFVKSDSEKMLKNLVLYIFATNNFSAFDFLYDYISLNLDFETLQKIDWDILECFKQPKICCLREISNAKTKDDVIHKLLPLLKDEDASSLILNLALRLELPEHFLPLYIHYLERYRDEKKNNYVKEIEKKIRDYITKIPVDI